MPSWHECGEGDQLHGLRIMVAFSHLYHKVLYQSLTYSTQHSITKMATTRRILSIVLIAILTFINGANAAVGGEDAAPNEFSFVVLISFAQENGEKFACGGTIISSRCILTAAHCFLNKISAFVVSGARNYSAEYAVVTRATQMIPHPAFKIRPYFADIGILVLEKDLELGQRQNAIPLTTEAPSNGTWAWLAGWGRTNFKIQEGPRNAQKITVQLSNVSTCKDLKAIRPLLCSPVEKSFSCLGDSGSGLIRGGTIIGVSSSGFCTANYYEYYTSVYFYRGWINSIIDEN